MYSTQGIVRTLNKSKLLNSQWVSLYLSHKYSIYPSNMWSHHEIFLSLSTCQQHVEFPHTRVQVDGCAEEVEGRGKLLHGQVYQSQVVQNFPVKRRQVVGPLQAADGLWGERSQQLTGLLDKYPNNIWFHEESKEKQILYNNRSIILRDIQYGLKLSSNWIFMNIISSFWLSNW